MSHQGRTWLGPTGQLEACSSAALRCVGIGIDPANLSLASILHGQPDVSNLFVERSPEFSWHDGQQTVGATCRSRSRTS
jgi:lysine/ornithine N-monooxygenase